MLFTRAFVLLATVVSVSQVFAGNPKDENSVEQSAIKPPKVYAVMQQQGPVCPFIPFQNLKTVRSYRERGQGSISLQPADFQSKIQGYARFLPMIRAMDEAYDALRSREGGAYQAYEVELAANGIKSSERNYPKRGFLSLPLMPTDKARRDNFTPFNINTEDDRGSCHRFLPIIQKGDHLYFYDYMTNDVEALKPTNDYSSPNPVWLSTWKDGNPDAKLYSLSAQQVARLGGKLETARIVPYLN